MRQCFLDNTVDLINTTLTSGQGFSSYQWLDCDNAFAIIVGETNQSNTATVSGNYAVILSDGSCTDENENP